MADDRILQAFFQIMDRDFQTTLLRENAWAQQPETLGPRLASHLPVPPNLAEVAAALDLEDPATLTATGRDTVGAS